MSALRELEFLTASGEGNWHQENHIWETEVIGYKQPLMKIAAF